jgi:hypothetical protein
VKLPGPWSHSSLNNYITCPQQYFAMRVEKRFPREESEASIWGTDVHEAIELYLTEGKPLPERMKQFQNYVDSLTCAACEFYVELQLGVLEDGITPCEFDDPECWSRCVVDFLRIGSNKKALALDHKSGRRREGSSQLKQNAAIIFANFPDVDELLTGYAWLQENGAISKDVYKRSDVPAIWKSFKKDLEELRWSYETGNWPTRPSGLCGKWCGVVDCIYNGRRKR